MLMVCPNCHSDQVIAVQDQHFCINCGQMVPETPVKKIKTGSLAVQPNGLPEGVKILPMSASDVVSKTELTTEASPETAEVAASSEPPQIKITPGAQLIQTRTRVGDTNAKAETTPATPPTGPKKRKPGRPKAGRLDVPKIIASSAPAASSDASAAAAAIAEVAVEVTPLVPTSSAPSDTPRRLSDIAPRRAPHPATISGLHSEKPSTKTKDSHKPGKKAKNHTKAHHVHKLGVPPLHFGAILAFSLRARVRPRLVALAALAALSFAGAIAYGIWLLLNGGLPRLSSAVTSGGYVMLIEALIFGVLYYTGRSVGQSAIIYGLAREADQRPVPFTRQLGIAVNTFGRRLVLDLVVGLIEVLLLLGIGILVLTGGGPWPVDIQFQIAAIFISFLAMLYLLTGLGLARGLAGVALTLTDMTPWGAAHLGWRLFRHRFELLGLRFVAIALETILALPLAALAIGFIVAAPDHLHVPVAFAVGVLAWLAGALFGVGTASWWEALYRRIVLVDMPELATSLLSSRQPADANRLPLVLLVALSSFLIAAALALPWLKLT